MIADHGFADVGVRYPLAPERRYPTSIRQVMAALGHLQGHAARLHIDPSRIVLVGDSAGAQISAQVAALTTNPDFAVELGGLALRSVGRQKGGGSSVGSLAAGSVNCWMTSGSASAALVSSSAAASHS